MEMQWTLNCSMSSTVTSEFMYFCEKCCISVNSGACLCSVRHQYCMCSCWLMFYICIIAAIYYIQYCNCCTTHRQRWDSTIKFSWPANLTISVQSTCRTHSSYTVTLARPSASSSLQITNRSFTYASPYLWNQLPSSFRQPHSVHSPPGSPHHAYITSSQSPSLLSSPITASNFHSRLKTHLFHKSFPPVFLIPSGLPVSARILDLYWT